MRKRLKALRSHEDAGAKPVKSPFRRGSLHNKKGNQHHKAPCPLPLRQQPLLDFGKGFDF